MKKNIFLILVFAFVACNEPMGKDSHDINWTSDYSGFKFSKKKQKAEVSIPSEGGRYLFVSDDSCLGFGEFKLTNFPNSIFYNGVDSVYCENCFSACFNDRGGLRGGTKFTITFQTNTSAEDRVLTFGVSPCTADAYTEFIFTQQAKSN